MTDRYLQAVAGRFGVQIGPQPLDEFITRNPAVAMGDEEFGKQADLAAWPGARGYHLTVRSELQVA